MPGVRREPSEVNYEKGLSALTHRELLTLSPRKLAYALKRN